jgi:hypothetical protein
MLLKFLTIQVEFSPQITLEGNVLAFNAELSLFYANRGVIVYVRRMSCDIIGS